MMMIMNASNQKLTIYLNEYKSHLSRYIIEYVLNYKKIYEY